MKSSTYTSSLLKRILASGAIGNILETYDMILITLMANNIANTFFSPVKAVSGNVINVLYVYLVGLLARPVGTIVLAVISDRIGRKRIMVISLIITGLSTALIGVLPSYSQIGIASTILLIILRIFQGFFTGVEYINSASYLIENAHISKRGYFASWTAIGISGGYLLASIVALIITCAITYKILPPWSWRLTFLFSIFGMMFGSWLRLNIPESIEFISMKTKQRQQGMTQFLLNTYGYIRCNTFSCISIAVITLLGCMLSYIYYIYIPMSLLLSGTYTQSQVLSINVASLGLVVIMIPIFGMLSDRYKRKSIIRVVCVLISLLAVPFFTNTQTGGIFQALIFTLLISLPSSCFFSLYPVIITESFPAQIRCTGASLIYQLSVSIEMAVLPFIITHYSRIFGGVLLPSLILIMCAFLCFVFIGGVKFSDGGRKYLSSFDASSDILRVI